MSLAAPSWDHREHGASCEPWRLFLGGRLEGWAALPMIHVFQVFFQVIFGDMIKQYDTQTISKHIPEKMDG